jgi:hypothetical protein
MSRLLFVATILLLVCSSFACGGPDKPCVNTLNALEISDNSADLWGYLDESATADVSFQILAIGIDYQQDISAGSITGPNSFSVRVNGLAPETTYVFTAGATTSGAEGWGDPQQFTTERAASLRIAPTVTTDNATDITSTEAVLHGTLQDMGTESQVSVDFQVGTNPRVYNVITVGIGGFLLSPTTFRTPAPLAPDTIYYFRSVAYDPFQGIRGYGAEKSFRTLP